MQRDSVDSTMIRSIGFDSSTSTLEVEFNSGAIWQYYDVPESLFYEMKATDSFGKFFRANIRNQYSESQIG